MSLAVCCFYTALILLSLCSLIYKMSVQRHRYEQGLCKASLLFYQMKVGIFDNYCWRKVTNTKHAITFSEVINSHPCLSN